MNESNDELKLEQLLSTAEIAKRAGVSTTCVISYVKENIIKPIGKYGNGYFFSPNDISIIQENKKRRRHEASKKAYQTQLRQGSLLGRTYPPQSVEFNKGMQAYYEKCEKRDEQIISESKKENSTQLSLKSAAPISANEIMQIRAKPLYDVLYDIQRNQQILSQNREDIDNASKEIQKLINHRWEQLSNRLETLYRQNNLFPEKFKELEESCIVFTRNYQMTNDQVDNLNTNQDIFINELSELGKKIQNLTDFFYKWLPSTEKAVLKTESNGQVIGVSNE